LNRLDDTVPPESETARVFDGIAQRIAGGKATPEDWQQAEQWLILWRDNDARLQPLLARSFLTQDLAPLSRKLSQVAIIGLQALDNLKHNRLVNAEVRNRNIDFLDAAAKPQSVLLLMVAPSVETLVKATRTN
jgi:hexosaminidase